jgi:hypothetical protein
MELIRELCSFEGRGPGTDAERRAANMLAGRLRAIGRRAEIEPTYIHPNYALIHAVHVAIALAGSLVGIAQPAIGFGLVLFAATSMYLDLNTRFYLLRRLFFRRASQNVVSPGANPGAPLRVILVAHYDAARSGYVFGERGATAARRVSERWRLLLGPWRLIFWGAMVPLLPILGLRMAELDAQWLSIIQVIPTVLLILAGFLLIDIALSRIVPGAYDNASGVAGVLSVAAELEADPAPNLDVWVVLTGAEECLDEGFRNWVLAHRGELDRERTVIVNVDSLSYGSIHYEVSEGPVISQAMDPELVELCEALAQAGATEPGGALARPLRSPVTTDAIASAIRRLRTIAITGLDEGVPPPWYHAHTDTPDRVNAASLTRATEFVTSLLRLLDRDAGRRAAP